ncbi:MAG: hypothetical protein WC307_03595 [Candidatus Nanoarchaeia archaeon]|jgi:hypothetical protein
MKPSIKQDIIAILDGVITAFDKYDPDAIMEWSDHIIHSASIYQEEHTFMVAVIVYSIGKIMAKGKVRRYPQEAWNEFESTVKNTLREALESLQADKHAAFDKSMALLQKAVFRLDQSFMSYVDYVVDNAKLKKGTKMFEHGVSLKRVAELFGVSEWDLRNYAGKTRILERDDVDDGVVKRLVRVRRFFK